MIYLSFDARMISFHFIVITSFQRNCTISNDSFFILGEFDGTQRWKIAKTFIDAQQTKRALANHKYIIKDTENEISAKLIFS